MQVTGHRVDEPSLTEINASLTANQIKGSESFSHDMLRAGAGKAAGPKVSKTLCQGFVLYQEPPYIVEAS